MKIRIFEPKTLAVLGFLLSLSIPASAQWKDNMGGNWNNPTSASIGNIINDRLWARLRAKARARRKAGVASTASTATERQPVESGASLKSAAEIAAATRFRSTGTHLTTREIANGFDGTPEEKEQMFQLVGTLLTAYENEERRLGRPHDFALALGVALAVNSSIFHRTPEPEEARLLEIGDVIGQLMAESNPFAGVPDLQKQKMYETMVIFTLLAQSGVSEAQKTGDSATAEIYRKLAGQTLQAMSGMPPEKLRFDGESMPRDNEPAPNEEMQTGNSQTTPRAAAMHAATLVKEFESNEVRANQVYGGKRVRIFGTVNSIEIDNGGKIVLTFKSSISTYNNARCYFSKSQSSRVAALSANAEATVEGTVRGLGGGFDGAKAFVLLDNCIVR